jgi:hypothetical protein
MKNTNDVEIPQTNPGARPAKPMAAPQGAKDGAYVWENLEWVWKEKPEEEEED